jgi:hypothetical protein
VTDPREAYAILSDLAGKEKQSAREPGLP